MTRINIVPPIELTDQHLIAEYREIFMIAGALRRRKHPVSLSEIPPFFTLNKGHVKFFYNKGTYLQKRYQLLVSEMRNRNFIPDITRIFPIWDFQDYLRNDWIPSEDDMNIVRNRIVQRIKEKPGWYRYYGNVIQQLNQYKNYEKN